MNTLSKDDYVESTFYGRSYHPNMLLLNAALALGAISIVTHNFSHTHTHTHHSWCLSCRVAVFAHLVELLFAARRLLLFLEHLRKLMSGWDWPRVMNDCNWVFDTERFDLTRDMFKCDSHVATSVYGIVALYL